MGQKGIIVNTPENLIQSDAQDWASIFDSLVGEVTGIAKYGKELEIQKVNDNELKLLDGLFVMQGHIIKVNKDTSTKLVVESGTLGMNRNDAVVVEYEKSSDPLLNDKFEFKVVRGVPVAQGSGTPQLPVLVTQDLHSGGSRRQEILYSVSVVDDKISAVKVHARILENLASLLKLIYDINIEIDGVKTETDALVTLTNDHALKIINVEAHIDNLNGKIDLIVSNTLGAAGTTKKINLPDGYENPVIIGIQYQNANFVWLNLVGEKSNSAEMEFRAYGGVLHVFHNLSALNGKNFRVIMVK